ncbi:MAG: prepilin-type N-terminal cleavage/methylation domain-containing protein, partial [Fimbriimonadaceae bacterium]
MLRKVRGFTLIELLVVIAVIAILAAILFPVFAQAKVSAKGTAALSNAKQIGTSMFIYSADFDDYAVLVGRLDDTAPVQYGTRGVYPWAYLLQPYTKSSAIFHDPVTSTEKPYLT